MPRTTPSLTDYIEELMLDVEDMGPDEIQDHAVDYLDEYIRPRPVDAEKADDWWSWAIPLARNMAHNLLEPTF